jgi:hypothetical protein
MKKITAILTSAFLLGVSAVNAQQSSTTNANTTTTPSSTPIQVPLDPNRMQQSNQYRTDQGSGTTMGTGTSGYQGIGIQSTLPTYGTQGTQGLMGNYGTQSTIQGRDQQRSNYYGNSVGTQSNQNTQLNNSPTTNPNNNAIGTPNPSSPYRQPSPSGTNSASQAGSDTTKKNDQQ